jgi:signal transduction histidine kinase
MALALGGWCAALLAALAAARLSVHAAARAERAQRACHELRGALTAVGLGFELAGRGGGLSPTRTRALTLELRRAGAALDDLAGGAGGGPPVELVPVERLLADSVEAWRLAAAGRPLVLDLGRSCVGATVRGAPARLAQATGNLLANAIEHGDGPVTVTACAIDRCVRIEVRDRGAGLPVALERLTARRSRLASPWAYQAHGHGLRIVDQVARSYGGRLEAAPSSGGARLVLVLPLAATGDAGRSISSADG